MPSYGQEILVMNALVQLHKIERLPVLVLFPHNRCNCRCMMCDIWIIRETRQIQVSDLAPHMDSIRSLGVQWLVLSGGEPLLHQGLGDILALFKTEGIRITLLSTGLLLKDCAQLIADSIDEVIVSLDGPPPVHNEIRRVPDAFIRLSQGITAIKQLRPELPIHARCTVQKKNHSFVEATFETALALELASISFLAVDITSTAFNRPHSWDEKRKLSVQLDHAEVETLAQAMEKLIAWQKANPGSSFIRESPDKLRRIVNHFRHLLGQKEAIAPRCNAPWISAVIEADGTVRPCFFHPPIGRLGDAPLTGILNSEKALHFRSALNIESNPICRNCVCSLDYKIQAADEAVANHVNSP
jgi:MoaA/NifB/PqqE/SkfB family radical SAM enzyme